jgi:PKD repeat protein
MHLRRTPEVLLALTVALALLLPAGCAKKRDLVINPRTGPTADFAADPVFGGRPLVVDFADQSSPGSSAISSWSWDFGDGGTSTLRNPRHTYLSNGTYSVSLSVSTTVDTDTETKTGYIIVSSAPVPPTAAFSGSPTDGTAPLLVQFTDESTQGSAAITSWAWNFGDEGTSTAENPSHTYSAVGTYPVSLTVTTSAGSDSESKPNYITARAAPVPPTAEFSGTPTTGPAPLLVQFTDQSTAGSAPITSRLWTFGDGGTSTGMSPAHTYTNPGSYDVSLTVTTADGQDSQTKTAYIQVCEPPAADFSGSPTLGVAPLTVLFTDESTGGATSWSWTFGDGGTSTAQNPSYTYSGTGTYAVSLTVGNACGSDDTTKTAYITVVDACPNPVYTIADATWPNHSDADLDGYWTSGSLRWNANVSVGCSKSVFAKIYYRAQGDATWTLKGQSPCYTITGNSSFDTRTFLVTMLPRNCYDFRIVLFECSGTVEKAVREPTDDADLASKCFEP